MVPSSNSPNPEIIKQTIMSTTCITGPNTKLPAYSNFISQIILKGNAREYWPQDTGMRYRTSESQPQNDRPSFPACVDLGSG